MTKKQYRMPNVSVGTVKKSIAAMASRWFRRNVSQRFATSGGLGARRSHRETVVSDRSKPSLSRCRSSRTMGEFYLMTRKRLPRQVIEFVDVQGFDDPQRNVTMEDAGFLINRRYL